MAAGGNDWTYTQQNVLSPCVVVPGGNDRTYRQNIIPPTSKVMDKLSASHYAVLNTGLPAGHKGESDAYEDILARAKRAGHMSPDMEAALLQLQKTDDGKYDPRMGCAKYYRVQSNQSLGEEADRVQVPVFIGASLDSSWTDHVLNAMKDINQAAPGLNLFQWATEQGARIKVYGNNNRGCSTRGNIIVHDFAVISLDATWPQSGKYGTALHELMHAFAFGHEHYRRDGEIFVEFDIGDLDEYWQSQYQVRGITGMNRFDPHSVMMYRLGKHLRARREADEVWATKSGDDRCQVLSELDKVALNMLYRPCHTDQRYNPQQSEITGLYYCGRPMFASAEKDIVKEAFTNGNCGPTNWANCAACRVLSTLKSKEIHDLNKWQGWTGLVYCGQYLQKVNGYHDGYCGPNNGPPCRACGELLYPGYVEGYWRQHDSCTIM